MSADVRIHVRLTGTDAVQFRELLKVSDVSASELLRVALHEYHRSHARTRRKPLDLLAGYVGAGEGPRDLSTNYKYLLL
jgi:hypothetical protein